MVIFLFWLGAMLLTLVALALLLPPLLRGNRGRATRSRRRQLERELAQLKARHARGELDAATYTGERERLSGELIATIENDALPGTTTPPPARGLALVLALGVPILALAIYFGIGRPDALDARAPAVAGSGPDGMPMDMAQAVASLEQRLQQEPDQLEGWLLLARSYRAMERFDDMLRATSSAMTLAPDEPQVLVEHAEAVALAGPGRRLDGEARQLLERALTLDPQQHKALWLTGIAELQDDNPLAAIAYWQRLRGLLEPGDPVLASLDRQIAAARDRAGLPAQEQGDGQDAGPEATGSAGPVAGSDGRGPATDTPGADEPQIQVQVALDPGLAERVGPGDTLFVFARAPQGGPPLAIRRVAEPRFPVTVTLGPAHRMIDGVQLRRGEPVLLQARVSRSGQAQPEAGDLEAEPLPLTPAARESVRLQINRIVR